MKNPSLRTWLLGSRLTAPPILLGSAWYTWQWWQAGGPNNLGLISIALFVISAKATAEVAAYRQWRADWRAMAPGGQATGGRPRPATIATILGLIVIGLGTVLASRPDAPPQWHEALTPLALGGGLLAFVLILGHLIWRVWPRRRAKLPAVALAMHAPLLRAPSLKQAYRSLPPHCAALLKGRP